MTRPMLTIAMKLPDGRTLNGRGRNLHTAVERIYNEEHGGDERRRVIIVEDFKRGHRKEDEHRYQGTFHAAVFSIFGDPMEEEGPVTVEVTER